MLTPTGRALAGGGGGILLVSALFGNLPVLAAGSFPLLLAAASGLPRKQPEVERTLSTERIERGGHVDIEVRAKLPRGIGIVEIHQELPEEFELLSGNNLQVATLGMRPRELHHVFRVRAPKRGEFELPPVTVRILHPLGLAEAPPTPQGEDAVLVVEPRPIAARIPRDLRARARRPFPEGDVARMGLATDDFKELRQYVPGDPAKSINWKATARNLSAGDNAAPLVNETEREGKKSVWLLVDGHARLSAGTNIEDAREHAADAALSVAEMYLRRNHSVGLTLARSGSIPSEPSGTGEAQVRRMRKTLARLRSEPGPGLVEILEREGAHFHRHRPLFILVTRLTGDDPDLEAALGRIGLLAKGRGIVPGLVVDVHVDPAVDEGDACSEAARFVLEQQRMHLTNLARAAGLRVVSWRPKDEPLTSVLARGRIA